MLVFIDESGDPGFKGKEGTTSYFVISLVIFDDELEAEKTSIAIKELKRELGFSDITEFKFSHSRIEVKEAFFKKIKNFKFRIRSLVVDKKVIYSPTLRNDKNKFYVYLVKQTLKYSRESIVGAKIRIDGSGDRVFRQNFYTYLRREVNSTAGKKVIENFKFANSKSNTLIQLADMIAGVVRSSYDPENKDAHRLKKIIKEHIQDEWPFH